MKVASTQPASALRSSIPEVRCGVAFDADFEDLAAAEQAVRALEARSLSCSDPESRNGLWTVRIAIDLFQDMDIVEQIDAIDQILSDCHGIRTSELPGGGDEAYVDRFADSASVDSCAVSDSDQALEKTWNRAQNLRQNHDFPGAIQAFQELLHLDNRPIQIARAFHEIGSCWLEIALKSPCAEVELDKAEEAFLESLAYHKSAEAQYGLAQCRCLQGQAEAAIGWLNLAFRNKRAMKNLASKDPSFGCLSQSREFLRMTRYSCFDRFLSCFESDC